MSKPEHIWLVDDERDLRQQRKTQLKKEGYCNFSEFDDCESFLAKLAKVDRLPDLILLDLGFPAGREKGLEVLRILRRTHNELKLPIIILTAANEDKLCADALEADANDFIGKEEGEKRFLARV